MVLFHLLQQMLIVMIGTILYIDLHLLNINLLDMVSLFLLKHFDVLNLNQTIHPLYLFLLQILCIHILYILLLLALILLLLSPTKHLSLFL